MENSSRLIDPEFFYAETKKKAEIESSFLKKQLLILGFSRLFAFLFAISPFVFFSDFVLIDLISLIVFGVLFFVLISKYTDTKLKKQKSDLKAKLCLFELNALKGDFSKFNDGLKYSNPLHEFSYDMDLFGTKSFFQSVNRCGMTESEALLAAYLTSNSIKQINLKQKAIQELMHKPEWCLEFRTQLGLQEEKPDQKNISNALSKHHKLLPTNGVVFSYVYGAVSLLLIGASALDFISWQTLLLPFFGGLLITGIYLKKTTAISQKSSDLAINFKNISVILNLVESQTWQSELLNNIAQFDGSAQKKYSAMFLNFSKNISSLDQRNNVFFALVANGFFLWDLRYATRAEKWILQNAHKVSQVFSMLNEFDLQISLAAYSFAHPHFKFPLIETNQKALLKSKDSGHPLIQKSKCVTNSFQINDGQFFVITGANMAGKSTFLRTVGVSIIMANNGLPVFSEELIYKPVKLISSMRSADSLINDESYFFAELKRLKFIVDQIAKEDYFIILDEILKGTNSKDKEEGSAKFLKRLTMSGSAGLIATHDLSLCQLAERNQSIQNYYFDAEIISDELHFDYKLKSGICSNMNASFLLRKMNIVD